MKALLSSLALAFSLTAFSESKPRSIDPAFDKELHRLVDRFDVSHISVEAFKDLKEKENILLLDTRERREFDVSRIPGAQFNGPDEINEDFLEDEAKDSVIVLYCSVGYRSSRLAKKLKKRGYTRVYNLWGSIFEWVNTGNEVIGPDGKSTQKIHTYNEDWSKWLSRGEKLW